ncbi:MAG: hypothetical protein ACXWPI_12390 [Ktedonobacterales bacterium]
MAGTTNDIPSNALSFAQYAVMSNDPLVREIVFSLLDIGTAMTDIPFVNKQSLIANGVRWSGNLPTVNWGTINSVPSATVGTPTPFQEQAFIIRNNIDVDKYLVQDQNQISDPRGTQLAAYLKAAAYDFSDKFINNDHISGDSNAIVGLKYRINNGSTFGVRSMNKIDAGGVDLRLATLTAAATKDTGNQFIEYLDQLLWSVDSPNGEGVTLYMNEVLMRRFNTLLRAMGTDGGFTITRDEFDRVQASYKGALIKDIGYKADQVTRIITNTENADGTSGSSTFTSVYAVNYSTDHFFGWQFEPLAAHDLGLLNDGVLYRTVIDWAGGLMNNSDRSIGRLFDIKMS